VHDPALLDHIANSPCSFSEAGIGRFGKRMGWAAAGPLAACLLLAKKRETRTSFKPSWRVTDRMDTAKIAASEAAKKKQGVERNALRPMPRRLATHAVFYHLTGNS